MAPKRREILAFVSENKHIDKPLLANLLKNLSVELDSSEQDFIIMTLFLKSQSFKAIPIAFFRDFVDGFLGKNEGTSPKNDEVYVFPDDFSSRDENIEKNGKTSTIQSQKMEPTIEKKAKNNNSKLPPIDNSKGKSDQKVAGFQPPPQKLDVNKKIMNVYGGKVEAIEEEKVGESVESYNDYLVKIKQKNEESFSIVNFEDFCGGSENS